MPVHDPRDAQPAPSVKPDRQALVMARRIIGLLLADHNPALGIELMAVVTGIGYLGDSEAAIARRHGLTRAAVSKRLVELTETFGTPPVGPMREAANRDRCAQARYRYCAEN